MSLRERFITAYCGTFYSTRREADRVFYSALLCGDISFIKEIITEYEE